MNYTVINMVKKMLKWFKTITTAGNMFRYNILIHNNFGVQFSIPPAAEE